MLSDFLLLLWFQGSRCGLGAVFSGSTMSGCGFRLSCTAFNTRQGRVLVPADRCRNRVRRFLPFCGYLAMRIRLPLDLSHHDIELVCHRKVVSGASRCASDHKKGALSFSRRDKSARVSHGLLVDLVTRAHAKALWIIDEVFVCLIDQFDFESDCVH